MVSCNNIKKIAVFCASRLGNVATFEKEAEILGKMLAETGYTLVYGSSVDGLMGVLASSVLAAGGKVEAYNAKIFNYCQQPVHQNFKYKEYDTIEERQRALIDAADAYVVFSGGMGTLFEYYHVANLIQIGIIPMRPIVIVNINGNYDGLLIQRDVMLNCELASPVPCEFVVTSAKEVISVLAKGFEKCRNFRK